MKESIADNTTGIAQDARALMVEPHSTAGRLKIRRSALDKRTNYRGMTANHLTRQVTGFRAFDKDAYRREDDLYDAAMYAALISLGDGTEARWSRLKWSLNPISHCEPFGHDTITKAPA
jgi:hypothetical protein